VHRAGPAVQAIDGMEFLAAPPISILIDQETVETATKTSDGMNKKATYLDQSLFSIACAVNDDGLTLFPLNINAKLDTPFAFPELVSCVLLRFVDKEVESNGKANGDAPHPSMKQEKCSNGDSDALAMGDVMGEVCLFAELLLDAIDSRSEENVANSS